MNFRKKTKKMKCPTRELNPGRIATTEYSNHYPTELPVTPIVAQAKPCLTVTESVTHRRPELTS